MVNPRPQTPQGRTDANPIAPLQNILEWECPFHIKKLLKFALALWKVVYGYQDIIPLENTSNSTAICKLVALIPDLHQPDCRFAK